MSVQRVVFRADGNAQIGLGHLVRCLALAEMLAPEFECVFASVNPPENARSVLGDAFPVLELPENSFQNERGFLLQNVLQPSDIVVLDGYHFDLSYQQKIKAKGCRLVCIDDLNAQPFLADAVVNHAPGVKPEEYLVEPYTRLCFGFDFALLRAPFLVAARALAAGKPAASREKGHVLITFGGADKYNLCHKIALLCLALPQVQKVSVVLGAGSQIPEHDVRAANGKLQVWKDLSAAEMCALMLRCSALLAPASTVVMEGLATGLTVLGGYYVPEQIRPYQQLKQAGCILPVGDWNLLTGADIQFTLANLPESASGVVDGMQPERFRELFRSLQF